jgi:hypothetical protein
MRLDDARNLVIGHFLLKLSQRKVAKPQSHKEPRVFSMNFIPGL